MQCRSLVASHPRPGRSPHHFDARKRCSLQTPPPQFKETNATFGLTAKPRSVPLGPLSRYHETFAKNGSTTYMTLRRDMRVGRASGQMYFTACGTLILRVFSRGFFRDEPDLVFEDYITLSDDAKTIYSRQKCYVFATKRRAEQLLVGTRTEPVRGLV